MKSSLRFGILCLLLLLLLILRRPDSLTNPQFWAEDGQIFFFHSLEYPGWRVWFLPHAGYLHVVPRLVASFAALLPPSWAPLIFNLSALIGAAMCCSLFSLNRYRYLLQPDSMRIALCVVMASAIQADELLTITCLHSYLFIGALLIILQPVEAYTGKGAWTGYLMAIAGLLCGLSSPAAVLLLPLAILLILRHSNEASFAPAAVGLAALVQIGFFLIVDNPGQSPPDPVAPAFASSLVAVAYRVVLAPMLGIPVTRSLSAEYFEPVLLIVIIALAVWLTSFWGHGKSSERRAILISVYLTMASVGLAISGRAMASQFWGVNGMTQWRGERYFFAGSCLFAYLLAVSIERWMPGRKLAQVLVLTAAFLPGVWGNFRTAVFIDYHWRTYGPKVDQWVRDQRAGLVPAPLSIPINPAPLTIELYAHTKLPGVTEGLLLRRFGTAPEDSKVYLIDHGRKRWVTSIDWILAHGYKWPADVWVVSPAQLSAIPLGAPVMAQ